MRQIHTSKTTAADCSPWISGHIHISYTHDLMEMERMLLLANRLALGIFSQERLPLVVVILSSTGDFVHISSSDARATPEIHLTKCCPSKYLKEVLKLLQFKNTYDLQSSYACSRFHGETIHDHPLPSSPLFSCPFQHRLTCVVPVVYPEETPSGLASVTMEYSAYFRKIFSSKQKPQFSPQSSSESRASPSSFHKSFPTESRVSSILSDGSIEIFSLFSDLAEELSLMRRPDYFPSSHHLLVESLNGATYVHCVGSHGGTCYDDDFQIWFNQPVEGSWQEGEILTLTKDLIRHQFLQREAPDDHTVTSRESESSVESHLLRVDNRYAISILELDCADIISPSMPSALRRKSEIAHLLSLREHAIRLQSSSLGRFRRNNDSKSKMSPPSLPPTIIEYEKSEYDHSGLYLLSDGTVRGFFPPDRLLLVYLPDLGSVRATLPDGREELYSVDQLLRYRENRNLVQPHNFPLPRETLLSLLTRRITQLLSFRRRVTNSQSSQESRSVAIEVTVSQYRNRRFLSQVESLLSRSSP